MRKIRSGLFIQLALVLVILVTLFAAATYYWLLAPTAHKLARNELLLTANQLKYDTEKIFRSLEDQLMITAFQLQNDQQDTSNRVSFNEHFIPVLEQYPQASAAILVKEGAYEHAFYRYGTGWQSRMTLFENRDNEARFSLYLPSGEKVQEEVRFSDYYLPDRPWYKEAQKHKNRTKVLWTNPYLFYTDEVPGMTAYLSASNSHGDDYTIAIDVTLERISNTTSSMRVGQSGFIALLDKDMRLIGLPRNDALHSDSLHTNQLLLESATMAGIPSMTMGVKLWQEQGLSEELITYRAGQHEWLAHFTPLTLGELPFYIGTFALKEDFSYNTKSIVAVAILIIAIALIISSLLALRISRTISLPLQVLLRRSERIGQLDFTGAEPLESRWEEFVLLDQSLDRTRFLLKNATGEMDERIRERTEELQAARLVAEQAASAKAEFLANMSHEIRNPLHAIIGRAWLLQQTVLSDKQRDGVEHIHAAGKNLLGIINDTLDFSKMEASRMRLETTPFSLQCVLEEVRSIVELKAQEKEVLLRIDLDPNLPKQLLGDPLRLSQVLVNLVSNAIKFTERGYVLLSVSRGACQNISSSMMAPVSSASMGQAANMSESPEDIEVCFEVADSGVGMELSQMSHLFEAFAQGDGSTTRKYGGTGLGLAISSRLVQLMGGNIHVESERGKGSIFLFRLRFALAHAAAEGAVTIEKPEVHWPKKMLEGVRILLVEDNDINQLIMSELLIGEGAMVLQAKNGKEALELLIDKPIQLVLMDLHMPVMDGYELIERLQQTMPHLPILVMSGSSLKGESEAPPLAGIQGYLTKPVQPPLLFQTIKEVLRDWDPQDY